MSIQLHQQVLELQEPEVWWKREASVRSDALMPSWLQQKRLDAWPMSKAAALKKGLGGKLHRSTLASHDWADAPRGRRGAMPHQGLAGAAGYDLTVYGALRRAGGELHTPFQHEEALNFKPEQEEEDDSQRVVAEWLRLVEAYSMRHRHLDALRHKHLLAIDAQLLESGGHLPRSLAARAACPPPDPLPEREASVADSTEHLADIREEAARGLEDVIAEVERRRRGAEEEEEEESFPEDFDAESSHDSVHGDTDASQSPSMPNPRGEPTAYGPSAAVALSVAQDTVWHPDVQPEETATAQVYHDSSVPLAWKDEGFDRDLTPAQLEGMLYSQLNLLESVETQVQAADELLAKQHLDQQQRDAVWALHTQHEEAAMMAQAWQESQFAWTLQCMEAQHAAHMQELYIGMMSAQWQVEAERQMVESKLVETAKAQQEEANIEREKRAREERKLQEQRAKLAAEQLHKERTEYDHIESRRRKLDEEEQRRVNERMSLDAVRAEVQRERELIVKERQIAAESALLRAAEEAEANSKQRLETEARNRLEQDRLEERRLAEEAKRREDQVLLQQELQERERAVKCLAEALSEVKEVATQVRTVLAAPLPRSGHTLPMQGPSPVAVAVTPAEVPRRATPAAITKGGGSPADSYDEDFEQHSGSYSQSAFGTERSQSLPVAATRPASARLPSKATATSADDDADVDESQRLQPHESILEEADGWSASEEESQSGQEPIRSDAARGGPLRSLHASSDGSLQEDFSRQWSGTQSRSSNAPVEDSEAQEVISVENSMHEVESVPAVSEGTRSESEASMPQSVHTASSGAPSGALARHVVEESFAHSSLPEQVDFADHASADKDAMAASIASESGQAWSASDAGHVPSESKASVSESVPLQQSGSMTLEVPEASMPESVPMQRSASISLEVPEAGSEDAGTVASVDIAAQSIGEDEEDAASIPSESGQAWSRSQSKASVPESVPMQPSASVTLDVPEDDSAAEVASVVSADAGAQTPHSVGEEESLIEETFHRSASWRSRPDRSASMASVPESGPLELQEVAGLINEEPSIAEEDGWDEEGDASVVPSIMSQEQSIREGEDVQSIASEQSHDEASVMESGLPSAVPSEVSISEELGSARRLPARQRTLSITEEASEHYTEEFSHLRSQRSQRTYSGNFDDASAEEDGKTSVEEEEDEEDDATRAKVGNGQEGLLEDELVHASYGSESFEADEESLISADLSQAESDENNSSAADNKLKSNEEIPQIEAEEEAEEGAAFLAVDESPDQEGQPGHSAANAESLSEHEMDKVGVQQPAEEIEASATAEVRPHRTFSPPVDADHPTNPALESLRTEVLEKEALLSQLRLEQRRKQEAKEERRLRRHANKLDHAIAKAQADLARESDESSSQGSAGSFPQSPPPVVRTALQRGSVDSLRERLSGQQPEVQAHPVQGLNRDEAQVPSLPRSATPTSVPEAGTLAQLPPEAPAASQQQEQEVVASMLPIDFHRSNSASSIREASLPSSPRSARSGAMFHSRRASRGIPPQLSEVVGLVEAHATDARPPPIAPPASQGLAATACREPSAPEASEPQPGENTPAHSTQAGRETEVDFELSPDSMGHTAPSSPGRVPALVQAPPLPVARPLEQVPSSWEIARESGDPLPERAEARGRDAVADSLTEDILCDLLDEIDWSPPAGFKPFQAASQHGGGDLSAGIRTDRQRLTDEALEVSPLGKAAEFADPTPYGDDQGLASPRVRLKLVDVSQEPGLGIAEAITESLVGDLVNELVDRTSTTDAEALKGLFNVSTSVGSAQLVALAPPTSSGASPQEAEAQLDRDATGAPAAAESSQSLTDNVTESILSGLVDELAKDLSAQELAFAFEEGEPTTS